MIPVPRSAVRHALPSLALAGGLLAALPAAAGQGGLTGQAVNDSDFDPSVAKPLDRALVTKLQVLLDRHGFSVGVIDGFEGENVVKAIKALEFAESLKPDGKLDEDVWAALAGDAIEPALVDYKITKKDVAGPFLEEIPHDYRKLAKLKRIAYSGPAEMLAERFHMDEDLLKELNPNKDFAKAGTVVVVADPGKPLEKAKIETIEVDGKAGLVRAFDKDGALAAFYPATVGSKDNPGPKGSHKVRTVAIDPSYTYDPEVNFTQGDVQEKLEIPPGPNGPVGTVWIDLTEPTYGIHGTAEPSKIDKTWSHGCVRLTNWDADELAHLVHPGTVVKFLDTGEPADKQRQEQAEKAPAAE